MEVYGSTECAGRELELIHKREESRRARRNGVEFDIQNAETYMSQGT